MRFDSLRDPRVLWTVSVAVALVVGAWFGPTAAMATKAAIMLAQQYGNWAVSIKGTPTVNVRDLDALNRRPYSKILFAQYSETPTSSGVITPRADFYTVPAGSRWFVIDQIGWITYTGSGLSRSYLHVSDASGTLIGSYMLAMSPATTPATQSGIQPTMLRIPPGGRVDLELESWDQPLGVQANNAAKLTVSGYFTTAP